MSLRSKLIRKKQLFVEMFAIKQGLIVEVGLRMSACEVLAMACSVGMWMWLLLLLGLGLLVGMRGVAGQSSRYVLSVWRLVRRHVILEAFHEARIHRHAIRFHASVDIDERVGRVERMLADAM